MKISWEVLIHSNWVISRCTQCKKTAISVTAGNKELKTCFINTFRRVRANGGMYTSLCVCISKLRRAIARWKGLNGACLRWEAVKGANARDIRIKRRWRKQALTSLSLMTSILQQSLQPCLHLSLSGRDDEHSQLSSALWQKVLEEETARAFENFAMV